MQSASTSHLTFIVIQIRCSGTLVGAGHLMVPRRQVLALLIGKGVERSRSRRWRQGHSVHVTALAGVGKTPTLSLAARAPPRAYLVCSVRLRYAGLQIRRRCRSVRRALSSHHTGWEAAPTGSPARHASRTAGWPQAPGLCTHRVSAGRGSTRSVRRRPKRGGHGPHGPVGPQRRHVVTGPSLAH